MNRATELATALERVAGIVGLPVGDRFADHGIDEHQLASALALLAPGPEQGGFELLHTLEGADASLPSPSAGTSAPATFAQRFALRVGDLAPDLGLLVSAVGLRLQGTLDQPRLQRAWERVRANHAGLSVLLTGTGEKPKQQLGQAQAALLVRLGEVVPESEREATIASILRKEGRLTLDLRTATPARLTLYPLGLGDHLLVLAVNRACVDSDSAGLVLTELGREYGTPSAALKRPQGSLELGVWQDATRSEPSDLVEKLYSEALSEAPWTPPLPTDFGRPQRRQYGASGVPVRLPKALAEQVRSFAQAKKVSPAQVLFGAWLGMLSRAANRSAVRLGYEPRLRHRVGLRDGVVSFNVPVLVSLEVAEQASFETLIRDVARATTLALDTQCGEQSISETVAHPLSGQLGHGGDAAVLANFAFTAVPSRPVFAGLEASTYPAPRSTTIWPVELVLTDDGEGFTGHLIFSQDQFSEATATRMAGHYEQYLRRGLGAPAGALARLSLLTAEEHQQVVVEWNKTDKRFVEGVGVHQLFEAQVDKTPEVLALSSPGKFTYRQLDGAANQVAAWLRAKGVGAEHLVAVALPSGPEAIATFYGVLKAGAAYVPLDPEGPLERMQSILTIARPKAMVAPQALLVQLGAEAGAKLALDDLAAVATLSSARVPSPVHSRQLAYVVFTSGSTGTPKGVQVEHRSVVNHNQAIAAALSLTPSDRVLQFTPLNFDAAAEEIYPPLSVGASIAIRRDMIAANALNSVIESDGLTVLSLPPAYMHQWTQHLFGNSGAPPASLRLVMLGGDRILPETLSLWQSVSGGRVPWFNVYGPTEATITSALFRLNTADDLSDAQIPIGKPLSNARLYLLGRSMVPVPAGQVGEIHIGGLGLARGYLGSPDQTADRFVPDPFAAEPGARLYRTGDLARATSDGRLVFVGRVESMVKIRGFRIELGDVEANLRRHGSVDEAVVTAVSDPSGEQKLWAYVTPKPTLTVTSTEVKNWLKTVVPDYMVPAAIAVLPTLPLTSNGKVDTKALPSLADAVASVGGSYVAPRNPTEETLAAIWAEVLGVARVGIHDDFFDLGGQSLTAMKLVSDCQQQAGIGMELQDVFEAPTIAKLVDRLGLSAPVDVAAMSDEEVEAELRRLQGKTGP